MAGHEVLRHVANRFDERGQWLLLGTAYVKQGARGSTADVRKVYDHTGNLTNWNGYQHRVSPGSITLCIDDAPFQRLRYSLAIGIGAGDTGETIRSSRGQGK
jgi:hypothetical protein